MGNFFRPQGQLTPQSLSNLGEIRTRPDIIDVLITCKYEEDPIKNEGARGLTRFSPILPNGSYPLPWTPEFRCDLAQNLKQLFPQMMLQIKFGCNRSTGLRDINV